MSQRLAEDPRRESSYVFDLCDAGVTDDTLTYIVQLVRDTNVGIAKLRLNGNRNYVTTAGLQTLMDWMKSSEYLLAPRQLVLNSDHADWFAATSGDLPARFVVTPAK